MLKRKHFVLYFKYFSDQVFVLVLKIHLKVFVPSLETKKSMVQKKGPSNSHNHKVLGYIVGGGQVTECSRAIGFYHVMLC